MFRQAIRQATLGPISAGSVATASIPADGFHTGLYLYAETSGGVALTPAQIKTDIGLITVYHDGVAVASLTATEALLMQEYYGDAFGEENQDGVIPIPFIEPHLPTDKQRVGYGHGMEDINNYTIEVKITSVTQVATLHAFAEFTDERAPLGPHFRITRYSRNFGQAAEEEINDLPKNNPAMGYMALFLISTAVVTDFTVRYNNRIILGDVPTNLNKQRQLANWRTPQDGMTVIDFGLSRDLGGFIPMAGCQDFRVTLNWATAPDAYILLAKQVYGVGAR